MSILGNTESYKESLRDGVKDYTCHGECSNCGECCGDMLPLTRGDILTIKAYLSHHDVKEVKHVPPTINPVIDRTCPFRNDLERKCNIYPARPLVCRLFKCNKQASGELMDITKYKEEPHLISMRSFFFGHK